MITNYFREYLFLALIKLRIIKLSKPYLIKQMHHLDKLVYFLCIFIVGSIGFSTVTNLKKDLLNQSNSINSAVTSNSQYLQTLN